ncbi:MAG TPA: uroporphyrinogen-III C-methyltransferase [Vicinamibacterales bacterium]|nr:uroporphyrinogen-III C-methyltransferase [Vicinamibacterales bacterium]
MAKRPCVFIVGAGPGDPGLITVRGQRYLEDADVVVYDHHVHARLLRAARPDAEKIDVGPAAPRPLDQDAISLLLVEKAREGKMVVRLKWGDPFVFDSGGKEALFLHEQQIPFEVVPGIPATIAVPTYAGIPITYPGAGDVVTLVRGHEAETDDAPNVDWQRLAGLDGTIVCYAGARQIGAIVQALVSNGRSPEESAALIYAGTTPAQETVVGALSEIARRARQSDPAMLVIGAVAGLRDHLRWFDDRPLFGRRIVVTRSREQAGELVDMLEERGADAIQAPTIRIAPPEDSDALDRACAEASLYHWIVFTSANGVESFMHRLLETSDVRDLKGVRICAIGPSTAEHVRAYGIRVDLTPDESRAEAVVEALKGVGPVSGVRFLLPRADIAREVLTDQLREAGADVTEVIAYRTLLAGGERDVDHDIYRMLLDRQIDAVTFTSASTVKNFAKILGEEQAADLLNSTVVASIGPVTAEAAQQLGIATTVMPKKYTVPDLVDALVEHFSTQAAVRSSAGL